MSQEPMESSLGSDLCAWLGTRSCMVMGRPDALKVNDTLALGHPYLARFPSLCCTAGDLIAWFYMVPLSLSPFAQSTS